MWIQDLRGESQIGDIAKIYRDLTKFLQVTDELTFRGATGRIDYSSSLAYELN